MRHNLHFLKVFSFQCVVFRLGTSYTFSKQNDGVIQNHAVVKRLFYDFSLVLISCCFFDAMSRSSSLSGRFYVVANSFAPVSANSFAEYVEILRGLIF